MPNLEDAIALAVEAHRGQVDKVGMPYILHPLRVMLALDGEQERLVGILHDVVEDTKVTMEDLRKAGYSKNVLAALKCVTKRKGEGYGHAIGRAASNPIARRVKLADLADNMDLTRLPEVTEKDRARLNRYLAARRRLQGA